MAIVWPMFVQRVGKLYHLLAQSLGQRVSTIAYTTSLWMSDRRTYSAVFKSSRTSAETQAKSPV